MKGTYYNILHTYLGTYIHRFARAAMDTQRQACMFHDVFGGLFVAWMNILYNQPTWFMTRFAKILFQDHSTARTTIQTKYWPDDKRIKIDGSVYSIKSCKIHSNVYQCPLKFVSVWMSAEKSNPQDNVATFVIRVLCFVFIYRFCSLFQ